MGTDLLPSLLRTPLLPLPTQLSPRPQPSREVVEHCLFMVSPLSPYITDAPTGTRQTQGQEGKERTEYDKRNVEGDMLDASFVLSRFRSTSLSELDVSPEPSDLSFSSAKRTE